MTCLASLLTIMSIGGSKVWLLFHKSFVQGSARLLRQVMTGQEVKEPASCAKVTVIANCHKNGTEHGSLFCFWIIDPDVVSNWWLATTLEVHSSFGLQFCDLSR
jgi:hypothetical protein